MLILIIGWLLVMLMVIFGRGLYRVQGEVTVAIIPHLGNIQYVIYAIGFVLMIIGLRMIFKEREEEE
jgi:hypothetical protein